MKIFSFIILLFVIIAGTSKAQTVTADQIVKNIKVRFSQINDYTADIEANVQLEKLKMPKVKIKVYFKQPDKFHYESKNFAMLPKGGVSFNPFDYPEDKYTYKLNGKENINNTPVYALEVIPKEIKKNTQVLKTYLWVDADSWVVKRVVNEKDEFLKIIIDFNHSWINGKYYMPTWIKISYDMKENPEAQDNDQKNPRMRIPKAQKGEVTMSLQNYIINSGLSDDLFKKTDKK
jgi:outer membrane lipoprotein-sorting protein